MKLEELEQDEEEVLEAVHQMEASEYLPFNKVWFEELRRDEEVPKQEKEELKPLLPNLKYAFLEEGNSKPVIIRNSLSPLEEEKVLRVMREYKSALGWSISDIKGISPAVCMHKIPLENDY